jgi:hypothetical protein
MEVYISISKDGKSQPSTYAPAQIIQEDEDKARIKLLANCTKKNVLDLPESALEIIAKEGEEFEIQNEYAGKLSERLEFIGSEYEIPILMKDSTGKNGYIGYITMRYSE